MILALTGVPLILVSILAFIFVLGVIIVAHEAGHFYFAKKAGILCHEFSIGMGPAIYKKQMGETTFCIRAIPIGGYVQMANNELDGILKVGDSIGVNIINDEVTEIILDDNKECNLRGEIAEMDLSGKDGQDLYISLNYDNQNHYLKVKNDAIYVFERNQTMQLTPYDRSFDSKSLWRRFITLLAGPVMNFIIAIIVYLIIFFVQGVPNYNSTVVGSVEAGYPASMAEIKVGDKITKVSDTDVTTWNEFSEALANEYSKNNVDFYITVESNGVERVLPISTIVAINSVGISNIDVPSQAFNPDIDGVDIDGLRIGNTGQCSSGKLPFSRGTIISKILNVDTNEVIELNRNSWPEVIKFFKDLDSANIKFEYYTPKDLEQEVYEYTKVSLDECSVITPWNNEVLSNQRVNKVVQQIGVSPKYHFSFFGGIKAAFSNFWQDFTLIFRTLKLLIAPSENRQIGISSLSSVVGIYSLVQQYVGAGFLALLSLLALLSVNIGVMNLLPIPGLDGGRIVFLLYELITKKKPSKKVESIITNVFFVLLLILFIYVTYNDILRLFK